MSGFVSTIVFCGKSRNSIASTKREHTDLQFRADRVRKIYNFYFHVSHIGFHKYSRLIFIFDLLYTPIAHQVLPVSLVDSVTAKVGDEKIYLTYIIYM